jgi:uncharacterized protein
VSDDVLWEIHGHAKARGKKELDSVIESDAIVGRPTHTIDRLIEEGDSVVVSGSGGADLAAGGRMEFVYCDVLTFSGEEISRVESYLVTLGLDSEKLWPAEK